MIWGWRRDDLGWICVSIVSVCWSISGVVLSVYCQYVDASGEHIWRMCARVAVDVE